MFPGTNPGEWEPTKIRSKTTTKRKEAPQQPQLSQNRDTKDEQPAAEQAQDLPPTTDQPVASSIEVDQIQITSDVTSGQTATEKVEPQEGQSNAVPPVEPPNPEQPSEPVSSADVEMVEAPAEAKDSIPDTSKPDTDMAEVPAQEEPKQETPSAQEAIEAAKSEPDTDMKEAAQEVEEDIIEHEDDPYATEGAVYPIVEGRIENWPCFFALLSHVYNMISPPFHSPVLFVSQPCWSARDNEMITQFVFENWKIPAFCLMDAALTGIYAYGIPTGLVVDVGYEKCDVTAVTEFQVNDIGRGAGLRGCGGQTMTIRLQQVLEKQGFTDDMAEQLKKSSICEILPAGVAYPTAAPNRPAPNPAAAASTGALDSGMNAKDEDGLRPGQAPRGPGTGTVVGEEAGNGEDDDNEGVLDVAAIVARDNAAELLAKREKERAEKAAAAKKGATAEAPRQIRLRNSERERATFTYVEYLPPDESDDVEPISRRKKREVEVGIERFMAATPLAGYAEGLVDTIAEAIHRAVLSVPDIAMRSALWDNLIVVGNGSRVRGLSLHLSS